MVAVAATSSGFRRRCVCWPHFTPQKPPSPALIPVAEPKFIGPPPNVYPKYLLPLPLSSSNFVHGCCHAFTPGRVASIANSKALLLGGGILTVGVARNNTLPVATFGPTLVVAFITKKISLFLCGGGLGWKSETKKADLLLWSKISYFSKIVPNDLSLFPAVEEVQHGPTTKSRAGNLDKHNHQSL